MTSIILFTGHSSVVERLVANEKVEVRPPLPLQYLGDLLTKKCAP